MGAAKVACASLRRVRRPRRARNTKVADRKRRKLRHRDFTLGTFLCCRNDMMPYIWRVTTHDVPLRPDRLTRVPSKAPTSRSRIFDPTPRGAITVPMPLSETMQTQGVDPVDKLNPYEAVIAPMKRVLSCIRHKLRNHEAQSLTTRSLQFARLG